MRRWAAAGFMIRLPAAMKPAAAQRLIGKLLKHDLVVANEQEGVAQEGQDELALGAGLRGIAGRGRRAALRKQDRSWHGAGRPQANSLVSGRREPLRPLAAARRSGCPQP
jgi:hypothetical protein